MPIFMPVEGVKGRVQAEGFESRIADDGGLQKAAAGTLVAFDLTFQDGDRQFHDQGLKVYVDVVYNHAAGDGGGPRVVVFGGDTEGRQSGSLGDDPALGGTPDRSYDPAFRGGVSVAAGDVEGAAILESLLAAVEPGVEAGGMIMLLQDGSVRSVGSSVDLL